MVMVRMSPALRRRLVPYTFVAPLFIVLGLVLAYPLAFALYMSLHDWTLLTVAAGPPFIGLDNYARALQDRHLWNSALATAIFVTCAVAVEFVIGFAIALLLNRDFRGRNLVLTLIFLPFMVTNVVIGITFKLMYNYDWGVANYLLLQLGLPALNWLGDTTTAMFGVIVADAWNTSAFFALILFAGLRALPTGPFEAARIDGASRVQTFFYVTLPLLKPIIMVALLWRFVDTFKIFDVIYILTGGGPARATEVLSIYAFRTGFSHFDLGYASAVSYLMTLVMVIVGWQYVRAMRREP